MVIFVINTVNKIINLGDGDVFCGADVNRLTFQRIRPTQTPGTVTIDDFPDGSELVGDPVHLWFRNAADIEKFETQLIALEKLGQGYIEYDGWRITVAEDSWACLKMLADYFKLIKSKLIASIG
jgi:hypothetical protein